MYPTKSSRGGRTLTNEKIRARAKKAYEEKVASIRAEDENAEIPDYEEEDIDRADTWLGNRNYDDGTYTCEAVKEVADLIVSK